MATLVNNCPRCGTRHVTFDVMSSVPTYIEYGWQYRLEVFLNCRRCHRPSVAEIIQRESNITSVIREKGIEKLEADLSDYFNFERWIDISVTASKPCPADVPSEIQLVFVEGTRCLAVGCYNASSAMFRLCLDLATKERLPVDGAENGPSKHERRNLAPRLRWLFSNGLLPADLADLSSAVKENGDDGAHEGCLSEHDAEDIYDFAYQLLDRLYSQPARLAAARQRREERRAG
jgi:hypothetical protein